VIATDKPKVTGVNELEADVVALLLLLLELLEVVGTEDVVEALVYELVVGGVVVVVVELSKITPAIAAITMITTITTTTAIVETPNPDPLFRNNFSRSICNQRPFARYLRLLGNFFILDTHRFSFLPDY